MLKEDHVAGTNRMQTIIVIHFHPIEKYPPAVNLLRVLAEKKIAATRLILITTHPGTGKTTISIPGVAIHRAGGDKTGGSRISRMMLYVRFNLKAFFLLVRNSPAAILYYETLSAGPPWLYLKLRKKDYRLFIHYHEYTSPEEYKTGMALNRSLHKCESSLYKKASWVSHTNYDRQKLFLADAGTNAPRHNFILPNYPPGSWSMKLHADKQGWSGKTGFVYVGALDTETMYLKEMAGYIAANAAYCYWDIYSENYSAEAMDFLNNLQAPNISFKGAVLYDTLPEILSLYQVGLILYNGHIPNYVYNVPNKLFEYAVCGLDVWFPAIMQSSLPFVTDSTWPKIIALDFQALNNFSIQQLTSRTGCRHQPPNFVYESVLQPLIEKINE